MGFTGNTANYFHEITSFKVRVSMKFILNKLYIYLYIIIFIYNYIYIQINKNWVCSSIKLTLSLLHIHQLLS